MRKTPLKFLGSLLAALTVATLLSACSARSGDASYPEFTAGVAQQNVTDMMADGVWPQEVMSEAAGFDGADAFRQLHSEQSIIKTGNATLKVSDPIKAADELTEKVSELGGLIAERNVSRHADGTAQNAELFVKVPAQKLDEFYTDLQGIGTIVGDYRSESDVTLQHIDLTARVATLETTVSRLQELLTTASSTSDLIEIESALSARQQELDSLRGQLDFLENQISFATVWVSLSTDALIPEGPNSFWAGFLLGLKSLWNGIQGAVVVLGIALPWLIAIGAVTLLVIYVIRVALKRSHKKE